MKAKLIKHYRLLSFLSGWLAVATLPPWYAFPVLFVSFSLLLWLIDNSATKGMAFKSGYYFGFAFFAFGLAWINNALLLDAEAFGWLVPITFLASGFFFGLFIAIPAWLSWYAKKDWARYLAFTALFVIFEWIRSFFLTGFPWNLLGSALAFSNILIQAAGLGGTYFLSLLVLLTAGAPFLYFNSKSKKRLITSVSIIAVILVFLGGFGAHHFYLENKKKGIWDLAAFIIGWLTSAMGIGFFIIGIVGIFCIIDLFTMSKTITKLMDDRRAELEATYRATGHV